MVKPLLASLEQGQIPADREVGILKLVSALGDADDLTKLFNIAIAKKSAAHLALLESAARLRNLKPAGDLGQLGALLDAPEEHVRASAARLAGLWKVEALREKLLSLLTSQDETLPKEIRIAASEGLVALGGDASKQTFTGFTTKEHPADLRLHALAALAVLDTPAAAKLAFDVLTETAGVSDPTPLFNAFLDQKGGPGLLAAALEGKELKSDVAKLGIRAIRNSIREEPALTEALLKAGNIKTGAQTLTPEEMQQLVADVSKQGDAARGEALFRRQDLSCFRCHAIGGAGAQTGPDLVSIGASAQIDYIVDSLLNPNKQIKEGYHSLIVVNDQGKVFSGIKVTQTDRDLILRNANGEELPIPLDTIEEQANGGSLMPAGLIDPLTRGELLDLVRFLSELGKVGPYSIGKARIVRRWQALSPEQAQVEALKTKPVTELPQNAELPWAPVYTTVAGTLPLQDLKQFSAGKAAVSLVRADLDVTTPGAVQLQLNSAEGLQLWLDGKPVTAATSIKLDLTAGPHQLAVAINRGVRKQSLKVELLDVAGSAAQVQILNGK